MGINLATYVGATQVHRMVRGDVDRAPTPAELDRMRALVDQAMESGAAGVSTSLQYAPAPYASTEELIALAKEAARYGGVYATHMRNEGDEEPAAIDEAVRIARGAFAGGDVAPENRWQEQLGKNAGCGGAHRGRPPFRSGPDRRHLRL